ncbi:MAG: prefoldin subunit alpha [Candidatus Thermoplasmatota archaeon]|nr:prefoldin subunit alpha [Candidatus Thermoplasmatota archaeon]
MEQEGKINLAEQLEYLKTMISSLDNQISILLKAYEEVQRAYSIIKDLELQSSGEMKTLIGAGIYASSTLNLNQKLLVPIGSDLYIEEEKEKTANRLEKNSQEITSSLREAQDRRSDLAARHDSIVSLVQQQSIKQQ